MEEADDPFLLPPASVRDLTIDYETVTLNDICRNEKTFPKGQTDISRVVNIKSEPGTEVQECSLLEKESNLSPTKGNQLSQTPLIEKGKSSTSESLSDSLKDQNGVSYNPKMSTCSDKNIMHENESIEDIFKYPSSEILNTSGESNEAIKNMKTKSLNDISNEKVNNKNIRHSDNSLHKRNTLSNKYPEQRLTKISDPSDNSHISTKIIIKNTNSEKETEFSNNDSTTSRRKSLQMEENNTGNENIQEPMLPPLIFFPNIPDKVSTTPPYVQNKIIDSPIGIHESQKTDLRHLTSSPKIVNVQKNCKRNFENYSREDNSTNESIKKLKLCGDKDHRNNIKVDKDFVNQCLINWKKNYPWASLEEDTWILKCNICSYYTSKSLHVCQIITFGDVYQVAKHLCNHNTLLSHRFLNFFGHIDVFKKAYETLRSTSKTFPSKGELFESIKSIVKEYNGSPSVDETDIIFLINTVGLVIRDTVNSTIKSRMSCGISVVCDPCRNILIVKYSDFQNYPQESVITNYVNSEPLEVTLAKVWSYSDLKKANVTFCKILSCSVHFPQTSSSNVYKEHTLPLLLPEVNEFLDLMRKTDIILSFEKFVWNLSVVYEQNQYYFQSLKGHALLTKPIWGLSKLNSFIFENYQYFKFILDTKYANSKDHSVSYCKAFVLDSSLFFFTLINATSCIANYLLKRKYEKKIGKNLKNKMEEYLKILKGNEVLYTNNEGAINVLSSYYKEVIDDVYYFGIKNILDFAFLFDPRRMANLSDHNYEADNDRAAMKKIWLLFHAFFPLSVETIILHLRYFGNHLLKISIKRRYYFQDIISLFNQTPELRENYSYIFQFYTALGTLPIIKTRSSRSMAFISILRSYLHRNFKPDVSDSLVTIVTGGPNMNDHGIKTLYHLVMNKILAL